MQKTACHPRCDRNRDAESGESIGGLLATIAGSAWARTGLRYSVTALAILLFLLALRRSRERVGRLIERFETLEKTHDAQRRMLEAAARRPRSRDNLAERCTAVSSDGGALRACPPVAEDSREYQAQAAEELALLPEGSAAVEMLADYAVMREQAQKTFSSC